MGRPGRRSPGTAALLVLLAILTAACSAITDDDEDTGAPPESALPRAATLLRVATGEWPACLNPLTCADDAARTLVLQHVVPKLMELDADGGYVPSPVLAGSPELRVDAETGEQTIVFVLAEDARWHDGRPITSSDVKGTWLARTATPGAASVGHDLITAVDDSDPLVARVTLREPWADWPELFGGHTGWLLQADAFDGSTDLTGRFEEFLPFGAGPYELVSFDERSLVLVAREDHWDPERQAELDQVRIDHFPDIGTAGDDRAGPVSIPGSADLLIPAGEMPEVPSRFDLRRTPAPAVVGLLFDRRTPPLASFGVRAAIDQAVDRGELAELAGADADDLVTCLGGLPGDAACGDDLEEEGSSVEGTDYLLEIDGWAVVAPGTRSRPGQPLAVPISYDPALEGAEDIAEAVADALVPRGFSVTVQPVAAATWQRRDREEGLGIGVYGVRFGTAERVSAFYRCDEGSRNPLAWCQPEPQELAGALVRAPDEGRRQAVADQLGELAAESLSWLPLHQRSVRWLVDPDRITTPDAAPLGSGPLGALHAFDRADR